MLRGNLTAEFVHFISVQHGCSVLIRISFESRRRTFWAIRRWRKRDFDPVNWPRASCGVTDAKASKLSKGPIESCQIPSRDISDMSGVIGSYRAGRERGFVMVDGCPGKCERSKLKRVFGRVDGCRFGDMAVRWTAVAVDLVEEKGCVEERARRFPGCAFSSREPLTSAKWVAHVSAIW